MDQGAGHSRWGVRGSGAGSLVAWALTITNLDPIRFGLLFERFLNPERISMPDFDIDFCQERRDEVIRYVQHKYGADRVAQIITLRQAAGARGGARRRPRAADAATARSTASASWCPTTRQAGDARKEAIESEPAAAAIARRNRVAARGCRPSRSKLEGLYRHASTHAAGVVIGDRPLDELVPLYRDPRSEHAGDAVRL
jgi:DNA polymerase III subunit alpha